MRNKSEFTRQIQQLSDDHTVYDVVYPLVYRELKKMAGIQLSRERNDHTITETELVHEVYIKMVNQNEIDLRSKNHFMALASSCMRQLLIDHARKKKAKKRGEGKKNLTYIDGIYNRHEKSARNLLQIEKALLKLEKMNRRLSDVVTMRFFGEMKISEIASVLNVSESTVHRDWKKAKGFLYKELKSGS